MLDQHPSSQIARAQGEADVCLIAEGCYPYVLGGVSAWIDWLIRSQPDLSFDVVAISATREPAALMYRFPDNVRRFHTVCLDDMEFGVRTDWGGVAPRDFSDAAMAVLEDGKGAALDALRRLVGGPDGGIKLDVLLNSTGAWDAVCRSYRAYSHSAFLDFFWAWRALVGGLLRMLLCPLPLARAYHTVSTGYAGLLGARAAHETKRPLILTEHGIYSNERRVEILMANWITDSVDTGGDFSDERRDIRHFWGQAFDGFARACYQSCTDVITLYAANQLFQDALGANPRTMRIIPNGVDVERFSHLARRRPERPTIAFVGRVTPIKDLVTFIEMVGLVQREIPTVRALVLGPLDEAPDYVRHCRDLVEHMALSDVICFKGPVKVDEYLEQIDVLVLTSISEALPLVLLEAGAAGIPCVTTDVGACREILEGRSGQGSRGGFVATAGDPEALAHFVSAILSDPQLGETLGLNLKERVTKEYNASAVAAAYGTLYAQHLTYCSAA